MGFQECYPRSTENIPLDDLQFVQENETMARFMLSGKKCVESSTRKMLIRRLPIVLAVSWTMIKKAQ